MALPRIKAVITADTKQAEAALDRTADAFDRTGAAASRAGKQSQSFDAGLSRVQRGSTGFRMAVQNASFQVGDFATQVGAGTRASVALGQQLPQLLGGFGVLGAALGAVVAIGVPLVRVMNDMKTEGESLTRLFGVLEPAAQSLASAFQAMGGAIGTVAEVVINNLDRVLITGGLVAGFYAGKWVASMVAARVATLTLATALGTLRKALILSGIGAVVVVAGEAIYRFLKLSEAAGGFGAAIGLVGDVFTEVFERMKQGVSLMGELFQGLGMVIEGAFMTAFGAVEKAFLGVINTVIGGLNVVREAGGAAALPEVQGSGAFEGGQRLSESGAAVIASAAGSIGDLLSQPLQSVQAIRDLLASIKEEGISLPELLAGGPLDEGGGGKSPLDDALTAQEERVRQHFETIMALTRGGLSDKLGSWGNYFGNLAALTGSSNRKLLETQKKFAAAQALVDAWAAHNKVLNDPSLPWWARIASAGQVLAAGFGAVDAINGVSASGGAASGGAAAAAAPAAPAPLDVRLSGLGANDILSGADVGNLLERLTEEAGDRGFRIMVAT